MIVVEMNQGKKIEYTLDGTILRLGDIFEVDLAERQEDLEVKIDVTGDDGRYIANIIIPPRRYSMVERQEVINGETVTVQVPEPEPLDLDTVTLQLWALPEETNENIGGV